jgi:hypothetical protein
MGTRLSEGIAQQPRAGISRLYAASHMPQGDKTMIDSYKIRQFRHVIRCNMCNASLGSETNHFEDQKRLTTSYAGLGFREEDGILREEERTGMCHFHICNACISVIDRAIMKRK